MTLYPTKFILSFTKYNLVIFLGHWKWVCGLEAQVVWRSISRPRKLGRRLSSVRPLPELFPFREHSPRSASRFSCQLFPFHELVAYSKTGRYSKFRKTFPLHYPVSCPNTKLTQYCLPDDSYRRPIDHRGQITLSTHPFLIPHST